MTFILNHLTTKISIWKTITTQVFSNHKLQINKYIQDKLIIQHYYPTYKTLRSWWAKKHYKVELQSSHIFLLPCLDTCTLVWDTKYNYRALEHSMKILAKLIHIQAHIFPISKCMDMVPNHLCHLNLRVMKIFKIVKYHLNINC